MIWKRNRKKNEKLTKKQSELEAEIKNLKRIQAAQKQNPAGNTYYGTVSQKTAGNKKDDEKRKCPKCGTKANEGDLFCQSCGTKL